MCPKLLQDINVSATNCNRHRKEKFNCVEEEQTICNPISYSIFTYIILEEVNLRA